MTEYHGDDITLGGLGDEVLATDPGRILQVFASKWQMLRLFGAREDKANNSCILFQTQPSRCFLFDVFSLDAPLGCIGIILPMF